MNKRVEMELRALESAYPGTVRYIATWLAQEQAKITQREQANGLYRDAQGRIVWAK